MVKTLEIILKEERESIAQQVEAKCILSDIEKEIKVFANPCKCDFHRLAEDIRNKIKKPSFIQE